MAAMLLSRPSLSRHVSVDEPNNDEDKTLLCCKVNCSMADAECGTMQTLSGLESSRWDGYMAYYLG